MSLIKNIPFFFPLPACVNVFFCSGKARSFRAPLVLSTFPCRIPLQPASGVLYIFRLSITSQSSQLSIYQ